MNFNASITEGINKSYDSAFQMVTLYKFLLMLFKKNYVSSADI
jgi:hypothetical protein